MTCREAYELELVGDSFLTKQEGQELAEHIRTEHPEEWLDCRLNTGENDEKSNRADPARTVLVNHGITA